MIFCDSKYSKFITNLFYSFLWDLYGLWIIDYESWVMIYGLWKLYEVSVGVILVFCGEFVEILLGFLLI